MAELQGVNAGRIASLPDTGPVVMVNLLRPRDCAACKRYNALTMPLIMARRGMVQWAGDGEPVAFGDAQAGRWDYGVVLGRHPSRAASLDSLGSPGYAQPNVVREQAVQRRIIVASRETCSKFALGSDPAHHAPHGAAQ